jgi:O-antigen biosynthesis protein
MQGVYEGLATMTERYIELFTKDGHNVTVLLTVEKSRFLGEIQARYKTEFGAHVDILPEIPKIAYGARAMRRSWAIYRYITKGVFDLVWFFDFEGYALYTLHGRFNSPAIGKILVVVSSHGSTRLSRLGSGDPLNKNDLLDINMEDATRSMADITTFPGPYFRDFANTFNTFSGNSAANIMITPNFVTTGGEPPPSKWISCPKVRLAFYGRLSRSKGLQLFIQVLNELIADDFVPEKVYFIGKAAVENNVRSRDVIGEFVAQLNVTIVVEIKEGISAYQAVQFMLSQQAVAVIPSFQETSGLSLLECLFAGVPAIHSDTGDMGSMTLKHTNMVKAGSASSLKEAFLSLLTDKRIFRDEISFDMEDAKRKTLAVLRMELTNNNETHVFNKKCEAITVGIVTHDRADQLLESIHAFGLQTCRSFKVLILNTGKKLNQNDSDKIHSFLEGTVSKVDIVDLEGVQQDQHISDSRNELIRRCRTKYLLFFDDDDVPLPQYLFELMRVAENADADIVTTFCYNVHAEEQWDDFSKGTLDFATLPVSMVNGLSGGYNFFQHFTGKAAMLVRTSLARSVGGMEKEMFLSSPFVDYAFYQKLSYQNVRVNLVPEPLYVYRKGNKNSIFYGKTPLQTTLGEMKISRGLCTAYNLSQTLCDILELAKHGTNV